MLTKIRTAQKEREAQRLFPFALFISDITVSKKDKKEINRLVKEKKVGYFRTINGIGLYEI